MGRIWGPGGWVGPGSRLENRTYLRWFRFLLHVLLGTFVFFLLHYFGWSDHRTDHEVVSSLLRAMFGGVFFRGGDDCLLRVDGPPSGAGMRWRYAVRPGVRLCAAGPEGGR